jgi:NAD(P)-dependent dehydrogenase (short-subunit alcohol dehydrogenase family)
MWEDIMRMEGKIGLVTAAGSGMGRAGAIRFASEGASVGVVDIDPDAVAAVVAEIEAAGGKALGITADLTAGSSARPPTISTVWISSGTMSGTLDQPRSRIST